jgi:succinate dehydrogenase / fumarate reductase flavoprotein subunit
MKYHQAIVIGGGLAGLRAAIEFNRNNIKVAIISKVHPLRSHSIAAQGGANAPLANHARGLHDDYMKHAFDTIKGSDYLADQNSVVRMTGDASERIIEMEHWGCPYSRDDEGKIAQRPFGGAGFPRCAYAADKTGHVFLHTLYETIVKFEILSERQEMLVYDEWQVVKLVTDGKTCHGVIALDLRTGNLEEFRSDVVVFATGGAGRMYANSTNALINTGYGMALACWEGIPLKDMEFIQFHPTTLIRTNILMTEGCRGEGGYLVNNKGERFLANYPDSNKAMEIAPRDIVSRNIMREIKEGRGFEDSYVHLDLRHLGEAKINERLPGIKELSVNFVGVDPVLKPIPVQPAQHYTMGGIDCDIDGATKIAGCYAAGECACVSVHGGNRLGGNSLLETIVFGKIAGEAASKYIENKEQNKNSEKLLSDAKKIIEEKINNLKNHGKELPDDINQELGNIMKTKVGIFRNKKDLEEAYSKIKELQARYKNVKISDKGNIFNYDLTWTLELEGSLLTAEAVVLGALTREESRGSQFREDFSKRNDEKWLRHTLAYLKNGKIELEYSQVNLDHFPPKERKY